MIKHFFKRTIILLLMISSIPILGNAQVPKFVIKKIYCKSTYEGYKLIVVMHSSRMKIRNSKVAHLPKVRETPFLSFQFQGTVLKDF